MPPPAPPPREWPPLTRAADLPRPFRWRHLPGLVMAAIGRWSDDRAPSMGAVFGEDAGRGAIVQPLAELLGREGAGAIEGLLGSVIGLLLLVVGATTVFAEPQASLDHIWRVPQPQGRPGWWLLLRTRLLSFGLVMGVGFLLMVSLVVSAALAAWGRWWAPAFGGWQVFLVGAEFTWLYASRHGSLARRPPA